VEENEQYKLLHNIIKEYKKYIVYVLFSLRAAVNRNTNTVNNYCSDGRANQTKNCDRNLTIKRKKSAHTHTRARALSVSVNINIEHIAYADHGEGEEEGASKSI